MQRKKTKTQKPQMGPHHKHHGEGWLLRREENLPAGTPGKANPNGHRVPHPGREGLQLGMGLGCVWDRALIALL